MGFRFRKSVKIAPGVRLNLNRKSASISLGGKGAHYTVFDSCRQLHRKNRIIRLKWPM